MSGNATFAKQYVQRLRADQLPIYTCLAGIIAWLGTLTVIVMAEFGVPAEEVNTLADITGAFAVFVMAFPIILPVLEIWVSKLQ